MVKAQIPPFSILLKGGLTTRLHVLAAFSKKFLEIYRMLTQLASRHELVNP